MTKENSYLKVSLRGFVGEYIIFRVPADKIAEAEAEYAGFEDDVARGGHTAWIKGPFAPGSVVDWSDRHRL